jgi:hypothetical protein
MREQHSSRRKRRVVTAGKASRTFLWSREKHAKRVWILFRGKLRWEMIGDGSGRYR